MRTIIKHITSFYLIAFVLLSSIAVPYTAMTCLVSDTSYFTVLIDDSHCDDGCTENSNAAVSFDEPACCLFDNGIIDIDSELVSHDVKTFVSFIPVSVISNRTYTPLLTNVELDRESAIQTISPVPLRILQQSFLC